MIGLICNSSARAKRQKSLSRDAERMDGVDKQMNERNRKPTKAALVMEKLQAEILSGKLAPNEKLHIDSLKTRYGISGSPVREALSRLAVNGLVQIEEQCGFTVAPLSIEELHDIYNVRAEIDKLALRMAIENGDDRWEAEILAAWHCLSKYIDPRSNRNIDPIKWDELQKQFLFSLVKGCNSPWLLKMHGMLYDQAARYRVVCLNLHNADETVLQECLANGERLVAAVLARNVELACELSTGEYKSSAEFIAQELRRALS